MKPYQEMDQVLSSMEDAWVNVLAAEKHLSSLWREKDGEVKSYLAKLAPHNPKANMTKIGKAWQELLTAPKKLDTAPFVFCKAVQAARSKAIDSLRDGGEDQGDLYHVWNRLESDLFSTYPYTVHHTYPSEALKKAKLPEPWSEYTQGFIAAFEPLREYSAGWGHYTKKPGWASTFQKTLEMATEAFEKFKAAGEDPEVGYDLPKTTSGQGTCPVCFRPIKLPQGVMALHGYERPGTGYIHGECFGVRYKPFEVSPEGTKDYIVYLEGIEKDVQKTLDFLNSDKVVTLHVPKGGPWARPGAGTEAISPSDPRWSDALKGAITSNERKIKFFKDEIEVMRARVRAWKPKPLPGV